MPNLNPQPLKSRKTTPLSAIAIPTLTPIPPPGAELNHVRRVLVQLGKCNRVLPIINTVNTGSVLTDSYTFQEQITGKFVCHCSTLPALPAGLDKSMPSLFPTSRSFYSQNSRRHSDMF